MIQRSKLLRWYIPDQVNSPTQRAQGTDRRQSPASRGPGGGLMEQVITGLYQAGSWDPVYVSVC